MPHSQSNINNKNILETSILADDPASLLIQNQLEKEISQIKNIRSKPKKIITISDFSKVPPEKVFSFDCYFRFYNRLSKREFTINGKQLEARIGLDLALISKLKNRAIKTFSLNNALVTFFKYISHR